VQADPRGDDQPDRTADLQAIGPGALAPRPLRPETLLDITAGIAHSCVRTSYGRVFCWGADDIGQVGRGPITGGQNTPFGCPAGSCVDRPHQVPGLGFASQVDAGADHTCALTSSGQVSCWGSDAVGQVGEGGGQFTSGVAFAPMQPAGTAGLSFTAISAGELTSCGTTASGIYCWGVMSTWPLGNSTAAQIFDSFGNPLAGFDAISAGRGYACALDTTSPGFLPCWGDSSFGQTGDGPQFFTCLFGFPCNPPPTVVGVAAQQHFTCSDMSDGTVQCFGNNNKGQLGNPSMTLGSTNVPQTVGGGQLLQHVTVGTAHACGLDPNGVAFCWGWGASGQLGNGSNQDAHSPVRVAGTTTYRAIAAGYWHTCAIGTDNRIYCWGGNGLGQIGTGVWADSPTPSQTKMGCIYPNPADPSDPCPT
jgi:alpha-tubulin suppressor-like RCC1 family protein